MKKNYITPSSSVYYINIEELLNPAHQSEVTVDKKLGPALDNSESGNPENPSTGFGQGGTSGSGGWSWGD